MRMTPPKTHYTCTQNLHANSVLALDRMGFSYDGNMENALYTDVDLGIDCDSRVVLVGPNGAGKTTTMRIIATLLEPTWGEAYVCGNSIYNNAQEIRRLVGYMPDFFGVYDDMKVIEYLEFFAAAYRIRGEARRKRCDEMLEVVDLDFKRDAFANTLSRGQTQRLGLAMEHIHSS